MSSRTQDRFEEPDDRSRDELTDDEREVFEELAEEYDQDSFVWELCQAMLYPSSDREEANR